MTRGLEGKSVKSARRVLEVLEYFSMGTSEVTVMEMSRALDYPQSSTSELLSSLVMLGYLHHDRHRRTFRPTVRVAAIGTGVGADLFRRGAMLDLVEDLHDETGAVVALGMAQRGVLHHVHVVGSQRPPCQLQPAPLLHSTLGMALLSATPDADVRALIHRLNAEAEPGRAVAPSAFMARLTEARERGYAVGHEPSFDATMLAVVIPCSRPDQVALGVMLNRANDGEEQQALYATIQRKARQHLAQPATARHSPLAAVAA